MFSVFSRVKYQCQMTFYRKLLHSQFSDANSLLQVENSGVEFKQTGAKVITLN